MMPPETTFVAAISQATDADGAWSALANLAATVAGHRLFTATLVDTPAGVVRRAYSSRPDEYPTSGTKPLRGNSGSWFETVFVRRRIFVANSAEDIAKNFPDHELIASLGCASIINLPVILGGDLVATVNLLAEAGHYTSERVAAVEGALAVPARLCTALAWRFDAQGAMAA